MSEEDMRTQEVTLERSLAALRDAARTLNGTSEVTAALAGRFDEPVVADALGLLTCALVDAMGEALDVLDAAGFPRR